MLILGVPFLLSPVSAFEIRQHEQLVKQSFTLSVYEIKKFSTAINQRKMR